MRNVINIDHQDNVAVREGIGERLREYLRAEPRLPSNVRKQVDLLSELEGQPPSIVPGPEHSSEDKPSGDVSGQDRSRFFWPPRPKR